jgi:hypothetical protein
MDTYEVSLFIVGFGLRRHRVVREVRVFGWVVCSSELEVEIVYGKAADRGEGDDGDGAYSSESGAEAVAGGEATEGGKVNEGGVE